MVFQATNILEMDGFGGFESGNLAKSLGPLSS